MNLRFLVKLVFQKTMTSYQQSCSFFFFFCLYSAEYIYILHKALNTVKILKIGTPEIITIIVLQLEQLDFTVQYCVQKMQTE